MQGTMDQRVLLFLLATEELPMRLSRNFLVMRMCNILISLMVQYSLTRVIVLRHSGSNDMMAEGWFVGRAKLTSVHVCFGLM